jgi:pyrroloquinoline quinone biosynthesis protein D
VSPADEPSLPEPSSRPHLAEGVRLQPDRRDGGLVLLYPEGVLRLNESGAEILGLCDGQRNIEEIITVLAGIYGLPAQGVDGDVIKFLSLLQARQLVRFAAGGLS